MSTEQRIPVNIEDEMRRSYLDYAMSVIIGRALPDVRDGLKPAHRRVLYAMRQMGLASNRAYRKCAKVVGEVIGNYHPHGDVPAYDTLVRLAQDFNMRNTLVDGQGNFGSVDGDSPAAYRYTEARLEALAESMMADLDKDTVEYVPNFDETTTEPTVLPTPFPNLLVNGSTGIAVGMATNVPPHNLREVCEGVVWYVEHGAGLTKEQKLRGLIERIPGPDFPTGGRNRADQEGRSAADRGHRDSVPGEQGKAAGAHSGSGPRQGHRGHLRYSRRIRSRRHARGD
jgi:DNA gyrase subunit A